MADIGRQLLLNFGCRITVTREATGCSEDFFVFVLLMFALGFATNAKMYALPHGQQRISSTNKRLEICLGMLLKNILQRCSAIDFCGQCFIFAPEVGFITTWQSMPFRSWHAYFSMCRSCCIGSAIRFAESQLTKLQGFR